MDLGDPDTPRWVQRLANFDRALMLLREAMDLIEEPGVMSIVKEGAIQRFEFTFELAWKTLKDFLEWRKLTLQRSGPADVIRAAFAAGYIDNGQDWMDALDARNQMTHVYRESAFEQVLAEVQTRYLPRMDALHEMLMHERSMLDG